MSCAKTAGPASLSLVDPPVGAYFKFYSGEQPGYLGNYEIEIINNDKNMLKLSKTDQALNWCNPIPIFDLLLLCNNALKTIFDLRSSKLFNIEKSICYIWDSKMPSSGNRHIKVVKNLSSSFIYDIEMIVWYS